MKSNHQPDLYVFARILYALNVQQNYGEKMARLNELKWWYGLNPLRKSHSSRWQRASAIDMETGNVFVPVFLAGQEQTIMLWVLSEGASIALHEGHIYAPASWMIKKFKDIAERFNAIEKHTRQHFRWSSELAERYKRLNATHTRYQKTVW